MKTLADVKVGEEATIQDVVGEDSITTRILEMGVTPGKVASVIGVAPLGDPIEIGIRDYRLSLRKSEAQRVIVKTSNQVN
jgi:ferrous iron transport protein A